MKFHIYKDKNGETRWRARTRNGRIKANSGEGFKHPSGCRKSLTTFINDVRKQVIITDETQKD